MNERFGKDFYRQGNSAKGSGHSVNCGSLKTEKLLSSILSRKAAHIGFTLQVSTLRAKGTLISEPRIPPIFYPLRNAVFPTRERGKQPLSRVFL